MIDFFGQTYQLLNTEELKKYENSTKFSKLLDLPSIQIRRLLTISDVIKYFGWKRGEKYSPETTGKISNLKESMVVSDALLLLSLGYEKVYLLDNTPGDTAISYIISSEDHNVPHLVWE